jgi:hypothetical protein
VWTAAAQYSCKLVTTHRWVDSKGPNGLRVNFEPPAPASTPAPAPSEATLGQFLESARLGQYLGAVRPHGTFFSWGSSANALIKSAGRLVGWSHIPLSDESSYDIPRCILVASSHRAIRIYQGDLLNCIYHGGDNIFRSPPADLSVL